MNYFTQKNDKTICLICAHHCKLKNGASGICGIRKNIDGEIKNSAYGYVASLNLDPIEKKPLYHFLQNSKTLSIGTVGCNFRCTFCQNHSISQTSSIDDSKYFTPDEIVNLALKLNAKSISYTYNEPIIFYDYAKDIGTIVKKRGLKNIFVTNGFASNDVLKDAPSWVDAANIDLKSFDKSYYKSELKGNLDVVLECIKTWKENGIWIELTTLMVPNIDLEQIKKMANFIKNEVGAGTPWHISRFFPRYKMLEDSATDIDLMQKAKQIALSIGLKNVYLGNV